MEKFGNSRNFYRDVIRGSVKSEHKDKFNRLPSGLQKFHVKRINATTFSDPTKE